MKKIIFKFSVGDIVNVHPARGNAEDVAMNPWRVNEICLKENATGILYSLTSMVRNASVGYYEDKLVKASDMNNDKASEASDMYIFVLMENVEHDLGGTYLRGIFTDLGVAREAMKKLKAERDICHNHSFWIDTQYLNEIIKD